MQVVVQHGSADCARRGSESIMSSETRREAREAQLFDKIKQIDKYRSRALGSRKSTVGVIGTVLADSLEIRAHLAHTLIGTTDNGPWTPEDVDGYAGAILTLTRLDKQIFQGLHLERLARRESARHPRRSNAKQAAA
jgi:hypothetical protein